MANISLKPATNPKAWKGNIPLTSRYTAGLAGEKFFRAMQEEAKLTGTVCEKCRITYVPAKHFCERCFSELTQWIDVGNTGKVISHTVVHQDLDGKKLTPPRIAAIIELGASKARMVHLLGEVSPSQLKTGMPVQAVWKPASERKGLITDLRYFKPMN